MSRKQDKATRRKAKLKARRIHAENRLVQLNTRIANAIMDLCADVLPEYVDDSKGVDLVGRIILWRMAMVAWNTAVAGRKEIDGTSVNQMKLDEESRKIVHAEINRLVRKKYERYPDLRTSIVKIKSVVINGMPRPKVTLGETLQEMPIPDFNAQSESLTPEQILVKRKELGLSQVKFAAELGVSVKKVSAWEHGKAVPTKDEVDKIRGLGVGSINPLP